MYAAAAIPARYALERGAWAEAASLPVRKSTFPHTDAITHFARALGAARSGNPKAAAADIEQLAALRDTLKTMQDAYWAEQVDIQRQIAIAWITFAEGDKARGIEQLRAAAAAEDATDKSAVSPGPLAPARELLGYMLLEAERPAEALVEFEATIKKEPNRFRGLYGGARAAEAAGQRARAIALYKQLLQVASELRHHIAPSSSTHAAVVTVARGSPAACSIRRAAGLAPRRIWGPDSSSARPSSDRAS